jgi:hypothetical protein
VGTPITCAEALRIAQQILVDAERRRNEEIEAECAFGESPDCVSVPRDVLRRVLDDLCTVCGYGPDVYLLERIAEEGKST